MGPAAGKPGAQREGFRKTQGAQRLKIARDPRRRSLHEMECCVVGRRHALTSKQGGLASRVVEGRWGSMDVRKMASRGSDAPLL